MDLERLQRIPVIPALLERFWRLGIAFKWAALERRRRRGDAPKHLPVPVVSVGNLRVGGTGKTPLVEALSREWLRRGGKPGLLSRGYRGGADGNDEFQLLRRRLPGVPHVQDPDRFRGGQRLLADHPEVDLVILDDGFQHRRLHRDLDLVLIDGTQPFGNGHCLPRGPLREPWSALRRADAFLITRTEEASPHKLVILRTFLAERFPEIPLIPVWTHADGLRGPAGPRISEVAGRRWGAFAGIGNPTAFFRSLRRLDIEVVGTRTFPDHHPFQPSDLESLGSWGRSIGADALICTEKDGVKLEKIPGFAGLEPPVHQLRIEFDLGPENPLDLLAFRPDPL